MFKLKSIRMILGFVISFTAMVKDDPPEVTEEGLHLVKESKMALVYAVPGVDLNCMGCLFRNEVYV